VEVDLRGIDLDQPHSAPFVRVSVSPSATWSTRARVALGCALASGTTKAASSGTARPTRRAVERRTVPRTSGSVSDATPFR
jgi:hypothetical protein